MVKAASRSRSAPWRSDPRSYGSGGCRPLARPRERTSVSTNSAVSPFPLSYSNPRWLPCGVLAAFSMVMATIGESVAYESDIEGREQYRLQSDMATDPKGTVAVSAYDEGHGVPATSGAR